MTSFYKNSGNLIVKLLNWQLSEAKRKQKKTKHRAADNAHLVSNWRAHFYDPTDDYPKNSDGLDRKSTRNAQKNQPMLQRNPAVLYYRSFL